MPTGTGSVGSRPGFGYSNWNGSINVVYVGVRTGTLAGGHYPHSHGHSGASQCTANGRLPDFLTGVLRSPANIRVE